MCRDKVHYELDNQGIRVVSGSNLDDDGSLSNGAGKSALVMSALWALTGRTDPRAEVQRHPGSSGSCKDTRCPGSRLLYM